MIQYFKIVDGALAEIDSIQDGCWINITPPLDQEKLKELSDNLEIPMDFFIDSIDIDEQSRFEREDGVDLIVLNAPIKNSDESEHEAHYITVPIGIISIPGIIITISAYESPILKFFFNRNIKNFDPANQQDFLLRIFDKTIYYFLLYLKRINHQRNLYQKELYNSSRNTELAKMLNLQKSLVYFATTLRDNEQLVSKIKKTDFIHIKNNEEATDFIDDIIIDTRQAREMADVYTNILNGTMDAFGSIISNNLNNVMKNLTSVTIVLMVPTLVASFFGMNVRLPFADTNYAYLFTIGLSAILAAIVVIYFRRTRIL